MIHRILVGLDGSPLALRGLDHAAVLARAFEAELVLLRVLEPQNTLFGPLEALHWRLARTEAQTDLEVNAKALEQRGLTVRAELGEGKPAEQIIDFARLHRCDLIVLASHGQGGISQFHLGSTAQKVAAESGLSVFIARDLFGREEGREHEEEAEGKLYRRIMAPVDCSPRSEWAAGQASAIARSQGAELLLASIVPTAESIASIPRQAADRGLREELRDRASQCAQEYVEALAARLAALGLEVRTLLEPSARVAQTLSELAARERVDLVVISAHGCGGKAPWPYGSVASRLIAHGSTPLLVLQDQAVRELTLPVPMTRAEDCRQIRLAQ